MRINLFKHPVLLLKSVAAVMYIIMGILIIAEPLLLQKLIEGLTQTLTTALAGLLVIYGIFRLMRVYQDIKALKTIENEEN